MAALPTYGTANVAYMVSWLSLEEDGPMWALNLMKYHPIAQYADGRETAITGAEADEIYKPEGPLARTGSRILLITEVLGQVVGDGIPWDRVAIAQYSKRRAMMDMQGDPEFQELHVHKEAAMDFTIVTATFPQPGTGTGEGIGSADEGTHRLLLDLVADASVPAIGDEVDSIEIGRFFSEDVMVGDERRWAEVRWHLITPEVADELLARPTVDATDRYVLVLDAQLDLLAQSLRDHTAGTFPAPAPA